jgi:ATP-dependent DNA ligase
MSSSSATPRPDLAVTLYNLGDGRHQIGFLQVAINLVGHPLGAARTRAMFPLPQFIPPQLSKPVEKPPSGPQWLHEIKLDGFGIAARIYNSRAQVLSWAGLDFSDIVCRYGSRHV